MQVFTPSDRVFEITLPDTWSYSHDEECYSFFDAEAGVGALQLTVLDFADLEHEPADLLSGLLRSGGLPVENVRPTQAGARASFEHERHFWYAGILARGPRALYFTYNCASSDRDREFEIVEAAIESIVFNERTNV